MVGCYGNQRMCYAKFRCTGARGKLVMRMHTLANWFGMVRVRSAIFIGGTFPHSNGMVTNGVPLGANGNTIGQRLMDNGIKWIYRKNGIWMVGLFWIRLLSRRLGCRLLVWDMKCYLKLTSENRMCMFEQL